MAASARTVSARAAHLLRSPKAPSFVPVARRHLTTAARRPSPATLKSAKNARFNSSGPAQSGGSSTGLIAALAALVGIGGGGYYLHSTGELTEYFPFLSGMHQPASDGKDPKAQVGKKSRILGPDYKATQEDFQEVYNDVAELLESNAEYDDGSYGPVCVSSCDCMFGG